MPPNRRRRDRTAAARPKVTVDTLDVMTVEDAVSRLVRGEIDVTLAERWVVESLVRVHPELEMGVEFGSIPYAAEVRASNPDLLRLVNDFAFEALPLGLKAPPLGSRRHCPILAMVPAVVPAGDGPRVRVPAEPPASITTHPRGPGAR